MIRLPTFSPLSKVFVPSFVREESRAVPSVAQSSPSQASTPSKLKALLKEKGILDANGLVTEKIPHEMPPLLPDQIDFITQMLDNPLVALLIDRSQTPIRMTLRGLLMYLKKQMLGKKWECQLVGGFLRRLFYGSPDYMLSLLKLLGIENPESFLPFFEICSQRRIPDLDFRFVLDEVDSENMWKWIDIVAAFLGRDPALLFSKKSNFSEKGLDYTTTTFMTSPENLDADLFQEAELMFIKEMKRGSLFVHDLLLNMHDFFQAEAEGNFKNVNFNLKLKEFWEAVIRYVTRTLVVKNSDEINFDGLPILISYYVRGWTLENISVEKIFLEKFLEKASGDKKLLESFELLFKKAWGNHHFTDPEAAVALAFNLCAAVKGLPGTTDEELLSIFKILPSWFKAEGLHAPKEGLLAQILMWSGQEGMTLNELFSRVYTDNVFEKGEVSFIDHRGGKALQIEITGAHKPIHLLIPEEHCRLSLEKVGQRLTDSVFSKASPLCGHVRKFSQAFWALGNQPFAALKKDPREIEMGYRAMMFAQLLEPSEDRSHVLLQHLPRALAAAVDPDRCLSIIESLKNVLHMKYSGLVDHARLLFSGRNFFLEWVKVLADREEEQLRHYSWQMWLSVADQIKKQRVQKEQELFDLYLPRDREKSLMLFSSFGKSLQSAETKLPYWKKLCTTMCEPDRKDSLELVSSAIESMAKIPMDSNRAKQLPELHARLFRCLMQRNSLKNLYPLMKQALSSSILHFSCSDVKEIWFELCQEFLQTAPQDAYEAFNLGKQKCLFIDSSVKLLEFQFQLAETLLDTGFRKNAAELIASIKPTPDMKKRHLALQKKVFEDEFTGLQTKTPDQIAVLFQKWLKLVERRSPDLKKAALDFIHYYSEEEDAKSLLTILCNPAARDLFKADLNPLLASVHSLVVRHKAGVDSLKLFFEYFDHFEEFQKAEGLLAAYEYIHGAGKLTDPIKRGFLKHASLLIQSSSKRLECFDFLRKIETHLTLENEGWSLLVQEGEKEQDKVLLHKLISELKSSKCPPDLLQPLIKQIFTDLEPQATTVDSQTLERIRLYASWTGYDVQGILSPPLLGYLESLDPQECVWTAIDEKELIKTVLPRESLQSCILKRIDDCCSSDLDSAITLGMEYGFFTASSLLFIAGEILFSEKNGLKLKIRNFLFQGLTKGFLIGGEPETLARCWDVYFSLCKSSRDQPFFRFVTESLDETSMFSQCLATCDPQLKRGVLVRLIESLVNSLNTEQELQVCVPIIEKVIVALSPPKALLEVLVKTYLNSSSPAVFFSALQHLDKLPQIEDASLYFDVFTRFAAFADQVYENREEMIQLIAKLYEQAIRFSKEMPFASSMLEGAAKSGSKKLLKLGYESLLKLNEMKMTSFGPELSLSIKNFLIALFHCNFPSLQDQAEQLIRAEVLSMRMIKDSIAELWNEMMQWKVRKMGSEPALKEVPQFLYDCLYGFRFVFDTDYCLTMSTFFMEQLAYLNSRSDDGKMLFQFLLFYGQCLNEIHPNRPILIEKSSGVISMMLQSNLMDKNRYPAQSNFVIRCYHPAIQALALESMKMKFVSKTNRTILVRFLANWMQSFILAGQGSRNPGDCAVRNCMAYMLTSWINHLSIMEIYDHMEIISPVVMQALEDGVFVVPHDLLLESLFMLTPSMQSEPFSKFNLNPEILRINLYHLISQLMEKNNSPSFAWGALVLLKCQGAVLQNFLPDKDGYRIMIDLMLDRFKVCVLSDPGWSDKTMFKGAEVDQTDRECVLLDWLTSVIKQRKIHLTKRMQLGEFSEDALQKSFNPLVFGLLSSLLELGDPLSRGDNPHDFFLHCRATAETLIDPDIWMCYAKNPLKYWKIFNKFISLGLRLFNHPKLQIEEAKSFAELLLMFFLLPKEFLEDAAGPGGKFFARGLASAAAISGTNSYGPSPSNSECTLVSSTQPASTGNYCPFRIVDTPDSKVTQAKIKSFGEIAKCLLFYFKKKRDEEEAFKRLICVFRGCAELTHLFPESETETKKQFLEMMDCFEGKSSENDSNCTLS